VRLRHGFAVGDVDNDGDDIFPLPTLDEPAVSQRQGRLHRYQQAIGPIRTNEFQHQRRWLDYDKDGYLDLFVANYVR